MPRTVLSCGDVPLCCERLKGNTVELPLIQIEWELIVCHTVAGC